MATPTTGLSWGSSTITWAFATPESTSLGDVSDAITDPSQQAAVTAGIEQWAQVSGVNLVQVSNPSQADIQVGYGNLSGLLGESMWDYNPANSQYTNATVLLEDPADTSLNGSNLTYSGSSATLEQLATHEFGAALGLAEGDGSDSSSVMNHIQTPSNQTPDSADIAAIDSLYGSSSNSGGGNSSGSTQAIGQSPSSTVSTQTISSNLSQDNNAEFTSGNSSQNGSVSALNNQTPSFTSGNPGSSTPSTADLNSTNSGSPSSQYSDHTSHGGGSYAYHATDSSATTPVTHHAFG